MCIGGCVLGREHEISREDLRKIVLQSAISSGMVGPGATEDEAIREVLLTLEMIVATTREK